MDQKFTNECGKKYGKLTVLEEAGYNKDRAKLWKCQCDCGNIIITRKYDVIKGRSQSCGCSRKGKYLEKELIKIGDRFGRLTVIKYAGQGEYEKNLWLCQCDCGNTKIVSTGDLRAGYIQSCGCLKKENGEIYIRKNGITGGKKLLRGEAAFRVILRGLKANAKQRNLEWTLSEKEVRDLIQEPCYYCGRLPQNHSNNKYIQNECNGDFPSNGLDRVDNSKGYTRDNVVSCCSQCNSMKEKMNISEFKDQITKIYKHSIENKKEDNLN